VIEDALARVGLQRQKKKRTEQCFCLFHLYRSVFMRPGTSVQAVFHVLKYLTKKNIARRVVDV
jgi:hypothetical protein